MRSPNIIPLDVRRVQAAVSDPARFRVGRRQCRLRQDARAGAARDQSAARRRRAGKNPLHHLHQGRRRQHGEARVRHARATGPRSTTPRSMPPFATIRFDAALSMPARRALARRLFARALETPGGLKVQTIHAFCTQLLHQFPFEANVAARFSVLDETAQMQLLEDLTLGRAARRRCGARQRARPRARHRHDCRRRPDVPRRRARSDRPARRDRRLAHAHRQRRRGDRRSFAARSASRRTTRSTASKPSSSPAP